MNNWEEFWESISGYLFLVVLILLYVVWVIWWDFVSKLLKLFIVKMFWFFLIINFNLLWEIWFLIFIVNILILSWNSGKIVFFKGVVWGFEFCLLFVSRIRMFGSLVCFFLRVLKSLMEVIFRLLLMCVELF